MVRVIGVLLVVLFLATLVLTESMGVTAAPSRAPRTRVEESGITSAERPRALAALSEKREGRVVSLCSWALFTPWRTSAGARKAVRAAERDILAVGRVPASRALRRLRDGLGKNDALRIAAAFDMAWIGMDYKRSRDILLFYSHSVGARSSSQVDWLNLMEDQASWDSLVAALARKHNLEPPYHGTALIAPEEMLTMVHALWVRRRDPVLVKELLMGHPCADGAAAEALAGAVHDIMVKDPRALLTALRPLRGTSWRSTASLLCYEMRDRTLEADFPKALAIARDPKDELRPAARRMLSLIASEMKRHEARR